MVNRVNVYSEINVFCYLPGVSIEFLCFPRPEEPIEHVISCLQALFTLLESPCAKAHIAQDQVKSKHGETTREEKRELCHFLLTKV